MNTVNTILGSVALLVASNAVVKADFLLAGPLPLDAGVGTGTITCSAKNESSSTETIFLQIVDASARQIGELTCPSLGLDASCSTAVTFSASTAAPLSPFNCFINSSVSGDGSRGAVRGSICATVYLTGLPGSTYCLQALFNNDQSGGWTPSGGP
jgi:hypothetical protein